MVKEKEEEKEKENKELEVHYTSSAASTIQQSGIPYHVT